MRKPSDHGSASWPVIGVLSVLTMIAGAVVTVQRGGAPSDPDPTPTSTVTSSVDPTATATPTETATGTPTSTPTSTPTGSGSGTPVPLPTFSSRPRPPASLLLAGGVNGLLLHDLKDLKAYELTDALISDVEFIDRDTALVATRRAVQRWDLQQRRAVATLATIDQDAGAVRAVAASRDGTRLAWMIERYGSTTDVYLKVGVADAVRIGAFDTGSSGREFVWEDDSTLDFNPAGDRLLFGYYREPQESKQGMKLVMILTLDGTDVANVPAQFLPTMPRWLPDGSAAIVPTSDDTQYLKEGQPSIPLHDDPWHHASFGGERTAYDIGTRDAKAVVVLNRAGDEIRRIEDSTHPVFISATEFLVQEFRSCNEFPPSGECDPVGTGGQVTRVNVNTGDTSTTGVRDLRHTALWPR